MTGQTITHTRLHLPGTNPSQRRPVRMVARDLDAAEFLAPHSHAWAQLTYALEGVLRVTVGERTWIVPPLRAIWIPPDAVHEVAILEKARLRALYVHAGAAPDSAQFRSGECEVIDVSPLLRELIVALEAERGPGPREEKISALLLDEVGRSTTLPMGVVMPRDKRLRALCDMLLAEPASTENLASWAGRVGASERTLARLFERELGMGFTEWRQQMRLAHAAPLLARGLPISRVAAELGYASQSAFSAMFKKTFGLAPSAFCSRQAAAHKPAR